MSRGSDGGSRGSGGGSRGKAGARRRSDEAGPGSEGASYRSGEVGRLNGTVSRLNGTVGRSEDGAVSRLNGEVSRSEDGVVRGSGGVSASPSTAAGRTTAPDLRAWAELLRLPALFTVPGDALTGATTVSAALGSRTFLAIGSSLCLYEAGMALNDWADRAEDAVERPHRPLPSGRVRPSAALAAACALTATGLTLAARAGRPALAVAAPLAATVWAYDLVLKRTPAGPAAMAATRALDLLLGAVATTGRVREALPSAILLGTHTLAVTTVSRRETTGGAPLIPLAALATTGVLTHLLTRRPADPVGSASGAGVLRGDTAPAGEPRGATAGETTILGAPHLGALPPGAPPPGAPPLSAPAHGAPPPGASAVGGPALGEARRGDGPRPAPGTSPHLAHPLRLALAAAYAATAARPYLHAVLNPSPPLTQRAVGGGIRATIPLQAALTARAGGTRTALLVAALAPLARRFARKVSVT